MVVRDTCCPLSLTLSTISSCFSDSTDSPLTSSSRSPSFIPALSAGLPLCISRRTWTSGQTQGDIQIKGWSRGSTFWIFFFFAFPAFSHSCVPRAPSPAEGGSRSPRTHWPGGVSGLCKAGYAEQRWWAGLGFAVGCSSARSRCQSLGWWWNCHIFSSTAKHYLLLPDKAGHY